jgi:hypothetical protein
MNAVTKHEAPGEVQDYAGGILAVIERAARDPGTDIDKLERLFALRERIEERAAKQSFIEAKIAMRPELPEITMKGHIIIRDKSDANKIVQDTPFARFEDIHAAVMPVLTAHGFDLSFRNGLAPDGKVRVTTILSHRDGHEESTDFDLPHDGSGSKNSVQAVGSSTSYGKRYGVLSILNIKVAGEDDDGQAASYKDPSGEPIARTKLDGPMTSKSALKAAITSLRYKVDDCVSADELNALLKAPGNKALIDQAERDWGALLTGLPNLPEDIGLKGEVERKRARLRETGEGLLRLLTSMAECTTVRALHQWRAANESEIERLDGPESRRFDREWDELEAKLEGEKA